VRIVLSVETFLPKIDGIVNIACLTLDYLSRYKIESIIVAPAQGVNDYANTPVIGIPCIVNPIYPEGRISFPTIKLYHAIRDFEPDLVHAIDPGFIGVGALISAKYLRLPTIASYHLSMSRAARDYGLGFLSSPIRRIRLWGFNEVDHALAPSRRAQRMLQENGVRRVGWWRRGVDAQRFHPRFRSNEMRNLLSDSHPEKVILLYVGRIAPEKCLHHLKQVLEEIPNTHLALIGGGPQQAELELLFKGLPVTFAGYLQGEQLSAAYASADIFAFTSAHESFGLVLAEAIASGIPVVSSRVGGAEDIIQHGETGYIFDVDDAQGFKSYIAVLATNPQVRKDMGERARQFAETLNWDEMMQELIYFYEDILREKGRNPGLSPINRPKSALLQPRRM
jgi:glycosyltransferase involved in cell wall biosynthesis